MSSGENFKEMFQVLAHVAQLVEHHPWFDVSLSHLSLSLFKNHFETFLKNKKLESFSSGLRYAPKQK